MLTTDRKSSAAVHPPPLSAQLLIPAQQVNDPLTPPTMVSKINQPRRRFAKQLLGVAKVQRQSNSDQQNLFLGDRKILIISRKSRHSTGSRVKRVFQPVLRRWLGVLVSSSVWQLWSLVLAWASGSSGGMGFHRSLDWDWDWEAGTPFSWNFVRDSSWSRLDGEAGAEVWRAAWGGGCSAFREVSSWDGRWESDWIWSSSISVWAALCKARNQWRDEIQKCC